MTKKNNRGAPKGNKNALGNKGGAPIGNTNATGNRGGGAPYGNLNAETHGLYSYTYWRNRFKAMKLYESLKEENRLDEFEEIFITMINPHTK